uniref:Uncharacterized protein n=1 Tax=Amicula sp. isolate GU52X-4 cfCalB7 TaxID=3003489 RepID=A0A9E9C3J6_9STRA|nr:hypothetical protein [Amicula sp. isolate GU52X-4 cfCalB7]
MELNSKIYKILKIKKYLKKNSIFFLSNGINPNSNNWLIKKQKLTKLNYKSYKVYNKSTIKILKNSIFNAIKHSINGLSFFIELINLKILLKKTILNNFESLKFVLLVIKFNNKIYFKNQLENLISLQYKKNKYLLYQFKIVNFKFYCFLNY